MGCTVLRFAYSRLSRAGRVRPPLAVFPSAPSWGPDEGGIGRHLNPRAICGSAAAKFVGRIHSRPGVLQHVAHSAIKRRRFSNRSPRL